MDGHLKAELARKSSSPFLPFLRLCSRGLHLPWAGGADESSFKGGEEGLWLVWSGLGEERRRLSPVSGRRALEWSEQGRVQN